MRRGAPARRPLAPPPDAPPAERQLALRVWVRILALQKRALAALRDELEREMTLPRFDLLANLARQDDQTLASLSRSLLVTAGNLTGLVDRAARDGLVERRADPSDRRAWRVHLTPKGQRAFQSAERRHGARVARLFGALTAAELAALLGLLDKVRVVARDGDVPLSRPRPIAAAPLARAAIARAPARKPKKEPR